MPKTPRSYKRTGASPYPRTGVRSPALNTVRRELFPARNTPARSTPRAVNKRQMFSPVEIGANLGDSSCKNISLQQVGENRPFNLYSGNLTLISRGTSQSQRLTDIVNCRGVSLEIVIRMKNLPPPRLNSDTYGWNVAIIAPRNSLGVNEENFFRDISVNNTRAVDFSTARSPIDLHTLPINTDKYVVLKHQRFMLNPPGQGTNPWRKHLKMYVPIGRQLAFTDDFGVCTTPIYYVYWFSRMWVADGVTQFADGDAADVVFKASTYFREPSGI